MDQTDQIDRTDQTDRIYQIGGVTYRLGLLSWQQNKWLGEHIFNGLDMQALDYGAVHDLLREKGPLFMAICLLPEGQDRKAHSSQPFSVIQARAQAFAGELTGGEVALFGPHFFQANPPSQMAMLVSGKTLQRQFEQLAQSLAPGANGSSAASSPSPVATSPSSELSAPSSDRLIPIHSSSDVLSISPPSAASLDSAALSSPG
jgi:hypothetical protein